MADPKVMKEGERDVELEKAQKGYADYEKQQTESQKKLDAEDAAMKEKVKMALAKPHLVDMKPTNAGKTAPMPRPTL